MNPDRARELNPDTERDILLCRIVDAQIDMRLCRCPPAPAVVEAQRRTQIMIRDCIARMQGASAP